VTQNILNQKILRYGTVPHSSQRAVQNEISGGVFDTPDLKNKLEGADPRDLLLLLQYNF
jgi:hypothetical protein